MTVSKSTANHLKTPNVVPFLLPRQDPRLPKAIRSVKTVIVSDEIFSGAGVHAHDVFRISAEARPDTEWTLRQCPPAFETATPD